MRKLIHNGFDISAGLKQSGSFVYSPFSEPFEAELLVVAGGGSGGNAGGVPGPTAAGGGGAGGLYSGSFLFNSGEYNVVVGAGGARQGSLDRPGNNGEDSSISGSGIHLVAIGGGGGGASGAPGETGLDGGSGGGAGWTGTGTTLGGDGLQPLSGSNHFGNNGGNSTADGGGGGGGAGSTGGLYDGSANNGGGGLGLFSSISGTSIQYARGGGGNQSGETRLNTPGSGGVGNGGSANAAGRNGVVIIRYEGPALKMRGGTLTKDGSQFIHTFTSDSTFII